MEFSVHHLFAFRQCGGPTVADHCGQEVEVCPKCGANWDQVSALHLPPTPPLHSPYIPIGLKRKRQRGKGGEKRPYLTGYVNNRTVIKDVNIVYHFIWALTQNIPVPKHGYGLSTLSRMLIMLRWNGQKRRRSHTRLLLFLERRKVMRFYFVH